MKDYFSSKTFLKLKAYKKCQFEFCKGFLFTIHEQMLPEYTGGHFPEPIQISGNQKAINCCCEMGWLLIFP